MSKGKSWPKIGQIVVNKNKEGKKFSSIKFEDNVEILVDGEKIDMNEYRSGNLISPKDEVEQLYKNGAIKEDKIESRRASAEKASSWLKYNIIVPPGR